MVMSIRVTRFLWDQFKVILFIVCAVRCMCTHVCIYVCMYVSVEGVWSMQFNYMISVILKCC